MFVGTKAQSHEGGGRILLVITEAEGRSRCRRSNSGVLEFGFQMASLVNTYTLEHVSTGFHKAPDLWNRATA